MRHVRAAAFVVAFVAVVLTAVVVHRVRSIFDHV